MGRRPHFCPGEADVSGPTVARECGPARIAAAHPMREPASDYFGGRAMRGTMVCNVSDTEEGRGALELAVELSKRLRLRLVLAHVASGITLDDDGSDAGESVSMKANREGATRLLARLAAEYGVAERRAPRSSRRRSSSPRPDRGRGGRGRDRRRGASPWPTAARSREQARRAARDGDAGAGLDRAAACTRRRASQRQRTEHGANVEP